MTAFNRSRSVLCAGLALLALGFSGYAIAERKSTTPEQLKKYQDAFMEEVRKGDLLFHGDAGMTKEMGVTISNMGMPCAICHPMASDTHPGSFPKYQPVIGQVVPLRDMVNWCIGNASRGIPIDPGSDAMKALEAYIYWSNSGSVLSTGKY